MELGDGVPECRAVAVGICLGALRRVLWLLSWGRMVAVPPSQPCLPGISSAPWGEGGAAVVAVWSLRTEPH